MSGLRCRLLGTPEFEIDGTPIRISSPMALHVWCVVMAARGRRVSDDQLVDALWPDDPPRAAISSLRAQVSRLRKLFEPAGEEVLVREYGGYRVPAEVVSSDVEDFELRIVEALGEQDASSRAVLLTAALDRWTGEPFDGVPSSPWIAEERARLIEVQQAAHLARLETSVEVGDAPDVLAELERRVRDRPADERAHALLALALYRAGRQAEALDAIQDARAVLREGWGLDPGPDLARLEQAILHQDPSLDGRSSPGVPVVRAAAADADGAAELSTTTGAVPVAMNSFVGRTEELAVVPRLLDRSRVVSIVAIGGTGKTRLALEVARNMTLTDGPWFVDLAGLHDEERLADTLAAGLDMLPGGGSQGLVRGLAGRETTLVLDNCEHLAGAVARVITQICEACAGVRVLATSRIALGIEGEQVLALGPLDTETDAVQLFLDRAAEASATEADLADEQTIADLCARVDGHPLAVELVARQTRALGLEELVEQLREPEDLLVHERPGSSRAGEGRSLGDIVAWSVQRLSESDRDRFWRLAVFDGGFELAAARAVCPGPGLIPGLLHLMDLGLLQVVESAGGRRYRMLEPIRAYAREAAPPGVTAEALGEHRRWVADLVRAAGSRLRGPEARPWSERLDREIANTRTALASAEADGDGVTARTITGEVGWFWYRRGYVEEGISWCQRALALGAPSSEPTVEDERATARTCLAAGTLSYLAGRFEELGAWGARAADHGERCGDIQTVVAARAFSAFLLALAGEVDEARSMMVAAEELARASAPTWCTAEVVMLQGQLHRALADPNAGLQTLASAAQLAREAGHDWCEGSALWTAAKCAWDVGDLPGAAQFAAAAIRLQHAAGDLTSWLVCLHVLAGALAALRHGWEAGVLLGALGSHSVRIAFDPEAMDPFDSPRQLAAVVDSLSEDELDAARAQGAELTAREVMEIVDRLVPAPRA